MRVYEIPEGSRTSKRSGHSEFDQYRTRRPSKSLRVHTRSEERRIYKQSFCDHGDQKRSSEKTSLEQYSRPRANGINAITIRDEDELLEAKLTNGNSQILLAVNQVRPSGLRKVKPAPWVAEPQVLEVSPLQDPKMR